MLAIGGDLHVEPAAAQQVGHAARQRRLVFDEQDASFAHAAAPSEAARQMQRERAAAAGFAAHGHRAAVRAGDQLDDAEAEADAAGLARQPLIDAIEAPEDPALLARGDADAVVADGEHHQATPPRRCGRQGAVGVGVDLDVDSLLRRRVFQRVVQEVDERRHQRLGVGDHRRKICGDVDAEVAVRGHPVANGIEGRRHDRGGAHGREGEMLPAALEARERQEVLDQTRVSRAFSVASRPRYSRVFVASSSSSASRPSTSTRIEASGVRSSCETAATRSVFSRARCR